MDISTRTPEGLPNRCPICGKDVIIAPSFPPGDAPCPNCGSLLWYTRGDSPLLDPLIAQVGDVVLRTMSVDLKAMSKGDAFRTLVQSLVAAGEIANEDESGIIDALLQREKL